MLPKLIAWAEAGVVIDARMTRNATATNTMLEGATLAGMAVRVLRHFEWFTGFLLRNKCLACGGS
jgi:hypothetical protein